MLHRKVGEAAGVRLPPVCLNRESERIPRRLRRGKRANLKKTAFLTVEDSLQLAAGIFNQAVVLTRDLISHSSTASRSATSSQPQIMARVWAVRLWPVVIM